MIFSTYNAKDSAIKELFKLEIRKSELEDVDTDFIRELEFALNFISKLGTCYSGADLDEKQKIIGSMFPSKLIFENKKYRTAVKSDLLSLLSIHSDDASCLVARDVLLSNEFNEKLRDCLY